MSFETKIQTNSLYALFIMKRAKVFYLLRFIILSNIIYQLPITIAYAQTPAQRDAKRDYIWITGSETHYSLFPLNGNKIKFPNFEIDTIYKELVYQETYSSVGDENGDLVCFSNGIQTCTKNFQITNGNDSLDVISENFQSELNEGKTRIQGLLILPSPNYNGKYHFFYNSFKSTSFPPNIGSTPYGLIFPNLYEAVFDNSLNGGQGDFIIKDRIVLRDTMGNGQIQACRHANGRDWWIVQRRYDTGSFYVYLFDVTGIHLHSLQHISNHIGMGVGQACFSPDGSKYVTVEAGCNPPCLSISDNYQKVAIYDFDRCTGILSNEVVDLYAYQLGSYGMGCAISPNNRFLYTTENNFRIFQYNLQSSDIIGSKQLVAYCDINFIDTTVIPASLCLPVNCPIVKYGNLQLAPDGRIYIDYKVINYYSVIESPNLQGTACNVIQGAVHLPAQIYFNTPNFPNFRLGPIDGSACDTLGINDVTAVEPPKFMFQPINIYPNPANYSITITINYALYLQNQIHVYNVQGALIEAIKTQTPKTTLHIAHYASGLYFIKIINPKGEVIAENKFVKQ